MRARMRAASVICGAVGIALLALLIATALTGSLLLAGITATVGIVSMIALLVLLNKVLGRATVNGDRRATKVSNLERRSAAAEEENRASMREFQASVRQGLDGFQEDFQQIRSLSVQSALQLGRRPQTFLTGSQAQDLFEHYLDEGRLLETGPLVTDYPVLDTQNLGSLRALYRFYRSAGYWDLAERVLEKIATMSQGANDQQTLERIRKDIALFGDPGSATVDLPSHNAYSATGPVLHLVGKMLPQTQSGYTLRTHYTARAQSRRGLPVVVVGQSGIVEDASAANRYTHEGIEYRRLPGPARREMDIEEWLRHNMTELARVVRDLRPSVLHAHSDFHNALIVHAVGRAHGIPTVYETRGFWEESWLTRTISRHAWGDDAASLFAIYGAPEAYTLRKHAEEVSRSLTDHNFTLAEVMKDHMLESTQGGVEDSGITVVPNAVDPETFPVQERDPELAARLGIPEDAITIGYISSMVEYEGIEILIDGFHLAMDRASGPLCLLLVGTGAHLETLKLHAQSIGIENVIFTGAVPHGDVLTYYGLIDIFVVPRSSSPVGELVTPLKPFEAFSTGRTVVLSDVAALREIAEDSGAAETFHAGDHQDLGRVLLSLVEDPQRRRHLGVRGARWVRAERDWDGNVARYLRVYRELGYRGPADPAVEQSDARGATGIAGRLRGRGRRRAPRSSSTPSEDGQRAAHPRSSDAGTAAAVTVGQATAPDQLGAGKRAVVVAMKPQIAGRIRRNIITLLDLGFEVVVVNSTPRADFFQGLEHPRLSADFVEVRSMAVRYQARMTRQKNERQALWDEQKKASRAATPKQEVPARMESEVPGAQLMLRGWTSRSAQGARARVERAWTTADKRVTKLLRTSRSKRDLAIRDNLKQFHLVNRFFEFWRLSPGHIAEHEPDLVVSSDLPGLVGANIAAHRLGVPHLHDCHELYLESTTLRPYERRVLWPVEKAYMRRADSVVVVNEIIRDEYESRYGVRGTVLRNAAPAVSEHVRANPVDLRALAGLERNARIVLYQGGLIPGRGLDVCIRAAAHFDPGVHLVLIGKGKSLEELSALVLELGVSDRVHFLPAVEPGELPEYTAGADVGVIPYQPVSRNNEYALPNKAFEYPGAGIPFVAADLAELRRIARTAGCGEVYDPFDPLQLAAAVRTVLDPERYQDYRDRAEEFGRDNTWESEREILVGEFRRLLGSAPSN